MLVAGVDEAGRGCVIGPLVVAGVAIKAENLPLLIELGVKDSKLLTAKKREEMYPEIVKITENQQHHKGSSIPNRQSCFELQNSPQTEPS